MFGCFIGIFIITYSKATEEEEIENEAKEEDLKMISFIILILRIIASWTNGIEALIAREIKELHHSTILVNSAMSANIFFSIWLLFDFFHHSQEEPTSDEEPRLFNLKYSLTEWILILIIALVNSFNKGISTMAY